MSSLDDDENHTDMKISNTTHKKRKITTISLHYVTLNIGGTLFQCDPLTFASIPGSVLARMFHFSNDSLVNYDKEFFF